MNPALVSKKYRNVYGGRTPVSVLQSFSRPVPRWKAVICQAFCAVFFVWCVVAGVVLPMWWLGRNVQPVGYRILCTLVLSTAVVRIVHWAFDLLGRIDVED